MMPPLAVLPLLLSLLIPTINGLRAIERSTWTTLPSLEGGDLGETRTPEATGHVVATNGVYDAESAYRKNDGLAILLHTFVLHQGSGALRNSDNHAPPGTARQDMTGQDEAVPDTIRPLLLVSSGGISLGSYQAGVNWAFLTTLHQARRDSLGLPAFDLAVATGASAGSINTLFATSEWYRPTFSRTPPHESLFWRFWTGLGLAELLPEYRQGVVTVPGGTCRLNESLLSRCYIEQTLVPDLVQNALLGKSQRTYELDTSIGITVTRQEPVEVAMSDDGLKVHTIRSVSAFRVRGQRGANKSLRIEPEPAVRPERNWDPQRLGNVIHLPLVAASSDRFTQNIEPVTKLVMASAAFPGAWAPVNLTFSQTVRADGTITRPDSAWFVDGGIFDNNPLTLAYEIYEYRKREGGWGNPLAVFVDPDHIRSQRATPGPSSVPATQGLGAVFKLLGSAVTTAREYELEVLARRLDENNRSYLRSSSRRFPVVGEHLGAFGAFLARPFREYDFYVGVYDGLRFTAQTLTKCESGDDACVNRETRALLDASVASGALADDPVGGRFVHMLLAKEEREYDPTARRLNCTDTLDGVEPLIERDVKRCMVFTHTLQSLERADLRRNEEKAKGKSVGHLKHFTWFVNELHNTEAGRTIEEWVEECSVTLGKAGAGYMCRAEPFVSRLLRDPEGWLYALAFQALDPAKEIEDREGRGEWAFDVARMGLYMSSTLQKRGFRWADSTVPLYTDRLYGLGSYNPYMEYGKVALRVIAPYRFFVNNRGGSGIGWRPIWRFSPKWSAVIDVSPYVQQRLFSRQVEDQVSRLRPAVFGGLGLQWSPRPLVDLDLMITASTMWQQDVREDVSIGWSGGVTLLHHIRLGLSAPEAFQSASDAVKRPAELTLGVRDPAGLLWWATSLLR